MCSLIAHLNSTISNFNSDTLDHSRLEALLVHPINSSKFSFHVSEDDITELYSQLPILYKKLLQHSYKSQEADMHPIVNFANENAKADSWLIVIVNALQSVNDKQSLQQLLFLLDNFIHKNSRFIDLIDVACESNCDPSSYFDYLSQLLVALPVYIANAAKNQLCNPNLSDREILVSILNSFKRRIGSKIHINFLYRLLDRYCSSGYAELVTSYILDDFSTQERIDQLSEYWAEAVVHMTPKFMEKLFECLLKYSSHPHILFLISKQLFSVCDSRNLATWIRFFRRMLFLRNYPNGSVPRNIFGMFEEIVRAMKAPELILSMVESELGLPCLRIWSDTTSIKNCSLQQRLYTTQALASWLVCFRAPLLSDHMIKDDGRFLLSDILSGIGNHLSSPREEVRLLGMAMGEWMIKLLNLKTENEEPLKFDYRDDSTVQNLRSFLEPLTPFNCQQTFKQHQDSIKDAPNQCHSEPEFSTDATKLDSDDDPDPLISETPLLPKLPQKLNSNINLQKRPRYLRECLDGMLLSKPEDSQTNLLCTSVAADLIYSHPIAAKELVIEFAHLLLNSEPPACPDPGRVESDRHAALVALGSVAPKQCARYLTDQFCQPNCAFVQRQQIISAITDIACKLSNLNNNLGIVNDTTHFITSLQGIPHSHRLYSQSSKNTELKNEFSVVAGDFFFPLLRSIPLLICSSESGTFSHQDASILARLISALAIIYACSSFADCQLKMAEELRQLFAPLSKHSEPAVRRASIVAIGTVVSVTPTQLYRAKPSIFHRSLITECLESSREDIPLMPLLKQCIKNESDSENQTLATTALSTLIDRIKQFSLT